MTSIASSSPPPRAEMRTCHALLRLATTTLIAFLTAVDLFAAQAILPALTHAYGVSPAAMSLAVNASTLGMAAGSLVMAAVSEHLPRRAGIIASLLLLAIPTALLATLPALPVFAALRVVQGVCMACAFTLTLAHLGESLQGRNTAAAFAAYITGNVASNLFGRLISAGVADHLGLAANFYAFAVLNIAGALLVLVTVREAPRRAGLVMRRGSLSQLRNPALLAGFGVGFCILFAFLGTFTFVNFVLARPPLGLGMMQIGLSYLVFAPSIVTTPIAGIIAERFGIRAALAGGLGVALAGVPSLLLPRLAPVLAGMVLVALGTFFAQAVATGFIGRAATTQRGTASGLYLASYFLGGLAASLVLGQVFDRIGWTACVAGIGAALVLAILLTLRLRLPQQPIQELQP
jgi:predicted MFS family arabinose efflux permease